MDPGGRGWTGSSGSCRNRGGGDGWRGGCQTMKNNQLHILSNHIISEYRFQ